MSFSTKPVIVVLLLTVASSWIPRHVIAQRSQPAQKLPPQNSENDSVRELRSIDLDVLIQAQPSYRIKSQEWGRAFQELGYTPQFRRPEPGETTRIEDIDSDGKLSVHVVCGMSADGTIRIHDRMFTIADAQLLKAYLDEMALYGAGGPPEKSAGWGMTDEQLLELTQLLSLPVNEVVTLQSPLITVQSLELPESIRMRFSDDAREQALGRPPESAPETIDLRGFSKGTAAAIVLAQYGLGFRPHRIAANSYEIEIDSGNESDNLWPVGWKTQETTAVTLPSYLKPIPVSGIVDTEVNALLQVVSDRLKLPVYQATFALASSGRDLDMLKYTRKDDKVSPSKLLSSIGDKLQLGFDVRVDEAGKLFLWATTSENSSAFRKRFSHVKQK